MAEQSKFEVMAERRRHLAHIVTHHMQDATEAEKQAFADYCVEMELGKKQIRPGTFSLFLERCRVHEQEQTRLERMRELVARHARLLAQLGLSASDDRLEKAETRTLIFDEIKVAVEAHVSRPYQEIEVSDEVMDEPDLAARLLSNQADELTQDIEDQLLQAEESFGHLIQTAFEEETSKWLGSMERVQRKYLQLPNQMTALEMVLAAESTVSEIEQDYVEARRKHLAQLLNNLDRVRFQGLKLSRAYADEIAFLSGTVPVEIIASKNLSSEDLISLTAGDRCSDIEEAVDQILESQRASAKRKYETRYRELERRIRYLPHIDYLTDEDIIATVAQHFRRSQQILKRKGARHVLVAVEERARAAKYREDIERLALHQDHYADAAKYYPKARARQRELTLFVGPTNSGKTWRALNELVKGDSGAYLAPLRLLALEGQEEVEQRGKECSFLTGEERDLREGATFISSTIEMMDFEREIDTVVIDEVQLLADERRGWAWLAAVLGSPAKRVVMTGSPDCVQMVQALASYLGEPLQIQKCERYNPLRVAEQPMRLSHVAPGTAVICFSRRDVHKIKQILETETPYRIAVVYGNLSPQVRREEARRFRSKEADILVATDAIAMGLNLPIHRVVFFATEKFDGEQVRPLSAPEIRQIAGRAGRYGLAEHGVASALTSHGLALIRSALDAPAEPLDETYFVAPGKNHIRIIGEVLQTESLERILTFFEKAVEFSDPRFTRSNIDELSFLASYVDQALDYMPAEERLTVAAAPVDIRSETVLGWFVDRMLPTLRDAEHGRFAEGQEMEDLFLAAKRFKHGTARSAEELRRAEDHLKVLTVYAWLAFRFPHAFTRLDECEAAREDLNGFVERSLRYAAVKNCVICAKPLRAGHAGRTCSRCARRPQGPARRSHRGGPQRRQRPRDFSAHRPST